jgi:hypothetical protein
MFQFLLASFQRLVFRDSIEDSPFPPLRAAGSTNENTLSLAFETSSLHL